MLRNSEKKFKSLEVEASKCAKLTDLFGAGTIYPPSATGAAAPGDEGGGPHVNDDERVEADMVSVNNCEGGSSSLAGTLLNTGHHTDIQLNCPPGGHTPQLSSHYRVTPSTCANTAWGWLGYIFETCETTK